jgi:two-component system, cell cycle sensor histidine kinase and response regulator CckA
VLEAADGREALALYAADPRRISLVLLDLTMPGTTGEETFQALRRMNMDVPVVVTCSYAERERGSQVAAANRCLFVQKPYSLAALREVVRRALSPNPAS